MNYSLFKFRSHGSQQLKNCINVMSHFYVFVVSRVSLYLPRAYPHILQKIEKSVAVSIDLRLLLELAMPKENKSRVP